MKLLISHKIRLKLATKIPPVTENEIVECFSNRDGNFLEDSREDHKSDPPTQWFIAETDYGKKLKIAFVYRENMGIAIRTAYVPNDDELRIYNKYGYEKG